MNIQTTARLACAFIMLSTISACGSTEAANPALNTVSEHMRFTGDTVELKNHSNGRHSFVSGHFGEKGPYNIIVDTGAGPNVIDKVIVEEMGLEKIGTREVLSGGLEPVQADIVRIPSIQVDGLVVENAEFIVLELGAMSLGEFHGVLGMELFADKLLTFDPGAGSISISNGELKVGESGVIPYHPNYGSGFKIEIEAAGQPVVMNLDTGAPSGFTFPIGLAETLPLRGGLQHGLSARLVGGERKLSQGTLDGDILIGGHKYTNPDILFIDPSTPSGNIGNAVLDDFTLTLDQKNKLVAFHRTKTPDVKKVVPGASGGARQLGMQLRGMGASRELKVGMVVPDSLAEKAGVKTGDILISVNGRPTKEFDMAALGSLFRSAAPLRLEMENNGEIRIIEIR